MANVFYVKFIFKFFFILFLINVFFNFLIFITYLHGGVTDPLARCVGALHSPPIMCATPDATGHSQGIIVPSSCYVHVFVLILLGCRVGCWHWCTWGDQIGTAQKQAGEDGHTAQSGAKRAAIDDLYQLGWRWRPDRQHFWRRRPPCRQTQAWQGKGQAGQSPGWGASCDAGQAHAEASQGQVIQLWQGGVRIPSEPMSENWDPA